MLRAILAFRTTAKHSILLYLFPAFCIIMAEYFVKPQGGKRKNPFI